MTDGDSPHIWPENEIFGHAFSDGLITELKALCEERGRHPTPGSSLPSVNSHSFQ
jgi:hypothetical protein